MQMNRYVHGEESAELSHCRIALKVERNRFCRGFSVVMMFVR